MKGNGFWDKHFIAIELRLRRTLVLDIFIGQIQIAV